MIMTIVEKDLLILFVVVHTMLLSLSLTTTAKDDSTMVPKGCRDRCGNVTISYPFGIGPDKNCYLNEWFLVNCTKSSSTGLEKPYLSSFGAPEANVGEILDISVSKQAITVQKKITPYCEKSNSSNSSTVSSDTNLLSKTPFRLTPNDNKFMLLGCGNALLALPGNTTLGCTSTCDDETDAGAYNCDGVNCCQIYFAYDVATYHVNFTNARCDNYAFFVEHDWFAKSFPVAAEAEEVVVPVVWSWVPPEDYLPPLSSVCSRNESLEGYYWNCHCPYPKKGNPYLENGCQDNRKFTLKQLSTIIGVSTSFGFLLLLSTCYMLYKTIKKMRMKKQRQKFFKRNGGLLLQQQLLAKQGTIESAKIFSADELDKATDHFNVDRILGRGGQGTVYKGMLSDGKIVAIKKSQTMVDENQLKPFINEVVILSQINHRNIVKLLGCCLETEVPMLVYEFISNGTLFSLIHYRSGDSDSDNDNEEVNAPLSWDSRLRIASEAAGALAYLHSATSVPIYHRDVKSSNILLDEKLRAKVSDFGISRSISVDRTHLTTTVKGTFGYFDPEYFRSSQFTEKSDVYSFGVVLVELLTGQKPISFEILDDDDENDPSLVARFSTCVEENRLSEIVDVQIIGQCKKEDVEAVAWLAMCCLSLNGKKRPTMKQVAMELDAIRASHHTLPMVALEIE